ncbi:hypothetical protein [Streptomyces longwoodensis]|uniref:hypothetical protein n=1 Tax=Streptomyces longwoodensis TaxID=68231 RepID=UPI000AB0B35E|nr:hypothetical protein [Streptomyces longwoodensis]
MSAKLTLPQGTSRLLPGTRAAVTMELKHVVAMEAGTPFTVADPGNRSVTVATGTVTNVENLAPARA